MKLQTINTQTAEALASKYWLVVSLKTVQEFLKLDQLNIDEIDLVRALIKWGKHQVLKDGDDPENGDKLRSKVLPALNLIRFFGMCYEDIAKLTVNELGTVLSADEKLQLMQSCLLGDEDLMPSILALSVSKPVRSKLVPPRQVHVVDLPYQYFGGSIKYQKKPFSFRVEFRVDKYVKLVGLNMAVHNHKWNRFFFTIFTSRSGFFLACGDSGTIFNHSTGQCVKVSPEIILRPGCYNSILFTFPTISEQSDLVKGINRYALREFTACNDGPEITLTGNLDVPFPISNLVFDES